MREEGGRERGFIAVEKLRMERDNAGTYRQLLLAT